MNNPVVFICILFVTNTKQWDFLYVPQKVGKAEVLFENEVGLRLSF